MEKEKIVGFIDLIEDGVENGSLKVEQIHRQIAEKPLEIAKQIKPLTEVAETLLGIQEQIIGNTYQTIRKVSKIVTGFLKENLG